jgi:uncharacterized membrane protein
MSSKLRIFTAWFALIFMLIATVALIVYLTNPNILQGRLIWLILFGFGVGLVLFIIIKLNDSQKKRIEAALDNQEK